ncbi:gamma-parvin isoform X1 [Xiphophorus couchianus]|uniref:gamma-parvin isoform X1 n=2 Tax=Xiphophorus couchianus TaxID=32473 RepID=UPI0010164F92|nr:gamma-parvin isoform X1 [Xiphophorus couchianus]
MRNQTLTRTEQKSKLWFSYKPRSRLGWRELWRGTNPYVNAERTGDRSESRKRTTAQGILDSCQQFSKVTEPSRGGEMEAAAFEYHKKEEDLEVESFQGEKRKLIQPTSLKDPKLENLKQALVDWINKTLKAEHIVIQSLEEDLYDGLVLHHLLARLGNVKLDVEEISLTSSSQLRKLEAIMKELDKMLGVEDSCPIKWDVKLIHNKDLLATIHLLVAMAKAFQPELNLPPNVKIDVVTVEVSKSGIRSEVQTEVLTEDSNAGSDSSGYPEREDPIEQLLKLEANKVNTVKKAILHFVNQNMATLGLQVADMDKQFADGVILLLLIGQLEGFFIPLVDFHLTPVSDTEMLHNVTLALDLLDDIGLQLPNIEPQDIVSQDVAATLRVLYTLFRKHKRN